MNKYKRHLLINKEKIMIGEKQLPIVYALNRSDIFILLTYMKISVRCL